MFAINSSTQLHCDWLIIASNRGPIEYTLQQDANLTYERGPGGMVTALISLGDRMETTWIALAMTEGDRVAFLKAQKESDGLLPSPLNNQKLRLRYVVPEQELFNHYRRISTELLWFTHHYMYHEIEDIFSYQEITDSWTKGYYSINQAIFQAICDEITRRSGKIAIMLHDTDYCLVSSMIRSLYPSIAMQQFIHLPWPDIRYWRSLPSNIIESIYTGLVGNDLVGFQTERDARNFLDGASSLLEGSAIDFEQGTILWKEHRTLIRTYPISVSVAEERSTVESTEAKEEIEKLRYIFSKKIIMRVDRIDPSKNIIRGFQAYAQMLDEHPELKGQVYFLAFLVPTRETILTYQRYKSNVLNLIEEINRKYGSAEWQPIHPFLGNRRIRALAAMQFYDVLLVNSSFDGMNLVVKEGVAVNQRNGVLVLSQTTGAFCQLGKASIPISPTHVPEIAQALYKALMLHPEERAFLAKKALKEVEVYDVNDWIDRQILDINELLKNHPV